mgnify:FL=1
MIKEFKDLNYKFNTDVDIDLKNIIGKQIFKFTFWDNGVKYEGKGETGNTSLWFPLNSERGIKYIPHVKKYDNMAKNVKYFSSLKSDVLPEIYGVYSNENDLFIDMENVKYESVEVGDNEIEYIPQNDKQFIKANIFNPPSFTRKCLRFFIDNKIIPYYDWYKSNQNNTKLNSNC